MPIKEPIDVFYDCEDSDNNKDLNEKSIHHPDL